MTDSHFVGERISYDDALCTVRYVGEVAGAKGSWLGVEWDDATRGKHDGSHKGTRYFQCVSKSATAASFVRPTRPADAPQSFVAALKAKYVEKESDPSGASATQIKFAGKVAEEVGFNKVRRQMAQLDELKIAILDGVHMAYAHREGEQSVAEVSPKLAHIDLSRNLFRDLGPVVEICRGLPSLKKLAINGNRFQQVSFDKSLESASSAFAQITELGIGDNMLGWEEICRVAGAFPSLTNLAAGANFLAQLPIVDYGSMCQNLTTLTLEYNSFTTLSDLGSLASLESLRNLYLKGNNIRSLSSEEAQCPVFSKSLQYIDVSYNQVDSWDFIDNLTKHLPGLTALRISHNPVYDVRTSNAPSATADEAHMFTIARIGQLNSLNFSKITVDDRSNAEMFYLSRITKQLAAIPEAAEATVLDLHPRWAELCEIYGEPDVIRIQEVNPAFLQARLVTLALQCAGFDDKTTSIPQSFDIYAVKGLVAKLYGFSPLKMKLVWETGEWDPVARKEGDDGDTSDEEDEPEADELAAQANQGAVDAVGGGEPANMQSGRWVKREVELRDGPRQIGYWIDGLDAKVRVEPVA